MHKITWKELLGQLSQIPTKELDKPVLVCHYAPQTDEWSFGNITGILVYNGISQMDLLQQPSFAHAIAKK